MNHRTYLTLAAIGVVSAACGGGASSPSTQSFAGTWSASKYELVSTSSPTTALNLAAQGASATLALHADNTFRTTLTLPGQPDEVGTGTWSASSDVLTLRQDAPFQSTFEFNYVLSGNKLALTGADSEWDFNGDGAPEPAKLNVEAVKT
jgi:hypothetical protein